MENFSGLKAILRRRTEDGPKEEEVEAYQEVPVPLAGVEVAASLISFTAEVTVSQRYVNREPTPLECVYYFPVEEGACVVSFSAKVDGRSIRSVVRRRDEAAAVYNTAVTQAQTAFLLEETRDDILKLSVGHLGPGAECTVAITYITEVPVEPTGGRVRLTIPTTIAPKYIPAGNALSDPAATALGSISYTADSPAKLTLVLTTCMTSPIVSVTSPSHELVTAGQAGSRGRDENGCYVATSRLDGVSTDMNRDIVVMVETEEASSQSRVVVEKAAESTVVLLSFVPLLKQQMEAVTAPVELVFLVDCSGSMQNDRIRMAGEALQLFLHSLPENAYFNIVRFGSTHAALFPESRAYNDESLAAAKELAAGLSANLGGTEILAPLISILTTPAVGGRQRQVFVLTDGDVSNSKACIDLVGEHSAANRVFTLGIGSAADRYLVRGMARAGRGTSMFTTANEPLAPKVLAQLKNAMQPCVDHLEIQWQPQNQEPAEAAAVDSSSTASTTRDSSSSSSSITAANSCQTPSRLPPVFSGQRLQVYRLLDSQTPVPRSITVTARLPGSAFKETVPVTHLRGGTNDDTTIGPPSLVLHKMFARKMIQDLEETYNSRRSGGGTEQTEDTKELILDLALRFGLPSRHTSLVAVDSKSQVCESGMVTRQVAHQLPQTRFGPGFFTAGGGGGGGRGMMRSARVPRMACFAAPEMGENTFSQDKKKKKKAMASNSPPPPPPTAAAHSVPDSFGRRFAKLDTACQLPTPAAGESAVQQPPPPQRRFAPLNASCRLPGAAAQAVVVQKEEQDESPRFRPLNPSCHLPTTTTDPLADPVPLLSLTSLQTAQGWFRAHPLFSQLLAGRPLDTLRSAGGPQLLAADGEAGERVWFTSLAVVLLETLYAAEAASWELIAEKARRWLAKEAGERGLKGGVEEVLLMARKVVESTK